MVLTNEQFISIVKSQPILHEQYMKQEKQKRLQLNEKNREIMLMKRLTNFSIKKKKTYFYTKPFFSKNQDIN